MSSSDFSSKPVFPYEKKLSGIVNTKTRPENLVEFYDLQTCKLWIRNNNLKRVCLQFPDSLLADSVNISTYLKQKLNQEIYILADTSYGSCCVDTIAVSHINGDGIIHFGDACLSHNEFDHILHVFNKSVFDLEEFTHDFEETFKVDDQVLIFYDVSYNHMISNLKEALCAFQNVEISELNLSQTKENKTHLFQIYGRLFSSAMSKNGSAVFIGKESILLNNLVLYLNELKWYHFDVDRLNEKQLLVEYSFNTSKFLRQRMHLVEKIKSCGVIGIIVCTLSVSKYLECVNRVRTLCKRNKKKSYILVVGKPNVAKLANFPEIDLFVLISCPQNQLAREYKEYYKPIVTLFEVEIALGEKKWDLKYMSDFGELLSDQKEDSMVENQEMVNKDVEGYENQASNALIKRPEFTVAEQGGAHFLQNRTWKGLEQNLGSTPVEKAVTGRSGIAMGYENENKTE